MNFSLSRNKKREHFKNQTLIEIRIIKELPQTVLITMQSKPEFDPQLKKKYL